MPEIAPETVATGSDLFAEGLEKLLRMKPLDDFDFDRWAQIRRDCTKLLKDYGPEIREAGWEVSDVFGYKQSPDQGYGPNLHRSSGLGIFLRGGKIIRFKPRDVMVSHREGLIGRWGPLSGRRNHPKYRPPPLLWEIANTLPAPPPVVAVPPPAPVSSLPPLTPAEVQQLLAPSPFPRPLERMLEEAGVAFTTPRDAAAVYPWLWNTPDAAKKAFQRARMSAGFATPGLFRVDYLRSGQGQHPSVAWLVPHRDPDAVRAFLVERLGPLSWWHAAPSPQPAPTPRPLPLPIWPPASPVPKPGPVPVPRALPIPEPVEVPKLLLPPHVFAALAGPSCAVH